MTRYTYTVQVEVRGEDAERLSPQQLGRDIQDLIHKESGYDVKAEVTYQEPWN